MPYANPEDKERWKKEAIAEGYGKRIYARRKLHRENALKFRQTLEEILSVIDSPSIEDTQKLEQIKGTAAAVLQVIADQELALKGWKR